MLFNSFIFVGFFAAFYPLYLALGRRPRLQNVVLLAASYVFYGYWDIRFLLLLWLSTCADFALGRAIGRSTSQSARKRLVLCSLVLNLGILGFFKYFNFFEENAIALLRAFGMQATPFTLQIVLPVGVSFYTFQSLGYIIDVYRRRVAPVTNLLDFALFVAFFPQLMAGPIERAEHMLPQFQSARRTSAAQAHAGVYLILWGYFKKIVVADGVAAIADRVFNGYTSYHGVDLWLGALAFTLQIYGDFSGYTDIARGLAKLLGFELMVNFRLPYFAASPSEFWQRWHVSLSSWLRDYLYIPLGGNRGAEWKTMRNLMLTMLLGGLWHGAAWNYVLWGAFHGAILVVYRLLERGPPRRYMLPVHALRVCVMFVLVVVGWILFRARSFEQIAYFATQLGLATSPYTAKLAQPLLLYGVPLLAIDALCQLRGDLLAPAKLRLPLRVVAYSALLVGIGLFSTRVQTEFIYFQF